jgi:hypothetical protein
MLEKHVHSGQYLKKIQNNTQKYEQFCKKQFLKKSMEATPTKSLQTL